MTRSRSLGSWILHGVFSVILRLCTGNVSLTVCFQSLTLVLPFSYQVTDFEITREDMAFLDSLDEGLVTDWDPTVDP